MTKAFLRYMLAGALAITGGLPLAAQQPDPQQPGAEHQGQQKADSSEQAFASLDTDKDGKLSESEFGRLYETSGKQASSQEKQNEFKAWDADGDGSVSKMEFSANYNGGESSGQKP